MKKRTPFVLIVFVMGFQLLFSQSKVESYYDENFEQISRLAFEIKSKQDDYRSMEYEINGQNAKILYRRKVKGKLTTEAFDAVKKQLNQINPLKKGFIIIVYYPGKDRCNGGERNSSWNIFDRDYERKVNKLVDNNHYWIYKDDENLNYYYPNKINWKKDENQLLENIFFKMHYPCFSSAVIDEQGHFISNLGEFGKKSIIEDLKVLKKKNLTATE